MASIVARRSIRMHLLPCFIDAIPCRAQQERALIPFGIDTIVPTSIRHRRIVPISTVSCSAAMREDQAAFHSEKMEQKGKLDDGKQEIGSRSGERFRLTGSCALVLQRGDITKWHIDGKTDAIVNAANERMVGGGGVDGAIHAAAGKQLLEATKKIPISEGVRCPVGSAVLTPGFKLPVSKIIHTVGPIYYIEGNPASLLAKAHKESVRLATENGLKYIAFPAISCGVYGYPIEEAAEISIQSLRESAGELLEVHFVHFQAATYRAWLAEAKVKLEKLTDS
ncbi:uncharacterized protein [Physcomitrium patens]|uniref:Macro domain-containing protein n=1 Tax=Physcomitrium patens TaxID=3218 RepID=A0A2K1JKP5_PHYPA|nr:uncharacterized protein LOC112290230 [Physcomitrium patens]PNR42111.1 hypothetical protein PHYPA_016940 [Physcomitrium patens]|eukprot:XP_024392080.1 uncharacterized protein LOC112290230 [Physcomitrella patens]